MSSLAALALLLPLVSSQCLLLTGSTACPSFSTYNVGLKDSPFTTVAQFDAYMLDQFTTGANSTKRFQTQNTCSSWSASDLRYLLSANCGFYTAAALYNGCQTSNPTPLLCKSIGAAFNSTYNTALSSCASTHGNDYVEYLASLSSDTSCVPGVHEEMLLCGFGTSQQAQAYCQTSPTDSCCQSSKLGGSQSTDSLLLPLTSSSSSSNTNGTTSDTPGSSSTAGLSTGATIGIGFAVLVGLIALGFVIAFMRKKSDSNPVAKSSSNNAKKNETYSSPPPAMSNYSEPPSNFSSAATLPSPADGDTMRVIYNYVPNLSDEIYLYVGDPIVVKVKFDDGWALGYNTTTKQEGSFPLACVGAYTQDAQKATGNAKINQRASSLYLPQGGQNYGDGAGFSY